MTMRVNEVIISSTAGMKLNAVKNSSVCTAPSSSLPPAPWPTSSGRFGPARSALKRLQEAPIWP